MRHIFTTLVLLLTCSLVFAQKDKSSNQNQGKQQDTKITTGASGVKRSIGYRFSSQITDSDPGEGIFRYNSEAAPEVSVIFVDDIDIKGDDRTNWFRTWKDSTGATGRGRITIVSLKEESVSVFDFTEAFMDAGGYWKLPVEYVSGNLPVNDTVYYYVFERIAHRRGGNESENTSSEEETAEVSTETSAEVQTADTTAVTVQSSEVATVEQETVVEPAVTEVVTEVTVTEPAEVTVTVEEPAVTEVVTEVTVTEPAEVEVTVEEPAATEVVTEVTVAEPAEVTVTVEEPAVTEVVTEVTVAEPAEVEVTVEEPAVTEVVTEVTVAEPAEVEVTVEESAVTEVVTEVTVTEPAEVEVTVEEPAVAEVVTEVTVTEPAEVAVTVEEPAVSEVVSEAPQVVPSGKPVETEEAPVAKPGKPSRPEQKPAVEKDTTIPAVSDDKPVPKPAPERKETVPVRNETTATRDKPATPKPPTVVTENAPVVSEPKPSQSTTVAQGPVRVTESGQTTQTSSGKTTTPETPKPAVPKPAGETAYTPSSIPAAVSKTPVTQNYYGSSAGIKHGKCYRGIIELGYGLRVSEYGLNNFRFNFINGFNIRSTSIGLGIGVRKYYDKPSKHPDWHLVSGDVQIPVFLDVRTHFSSKRVTPWLGIGIGGASGLDSDTTNNASEGLYFHANGGIWFNISERFALFGGLAYETQNLRYANFSDEIVYNKYANSLSLNIGIAF